MANCVFCQTELRQGAKVCRHCKNVQPSGLPAMLAHQAEIQRVTEELLRSHSEKGNEGS